MTQVATLQVDDGIEYPSSDGEPMADNSIQFDLIQLLSSNLRNLFRERTDVFVGGNLFWYPVQGKPEIVRAPDVFVVFGRPGEEPRDSYLQWIEANIPMTVVIEIRSPKDGDTLMEQKFEFYQRYGVEEYYILDPFRLRIQAYRRVGSQLVERVVPAEGTVSPRVGVRFQIVDRTVEAFYPDGRRFEPLETFAERTEQAEERAEQAEERAEQAEERADLLQQRMNRMMALMGKLLRGEASAEEVAELQTLQSAALPDSPARGNG